MDAPSFETALNDRVGGMLDACTRCGKCVEVCPSVQPAGIADASPQDVISGIIDIVRSGEGPAAARTWAASCLLSGECIKACDYGVNPRFLLAMARLSMAKHKGAAEERRRQGVQKFRDLGRDVTVLSRYNAKLLEFGIANTTAMFEYFWKMAEAKSTPELVEMATRQARAQFDTFMEQTKQLQAIAQKGMPKGPGG